MKHETTYQVIKRKRNKRDETAPSSRHENTIKHEARRQTMKRKREITPSKVARRGKIQPRHGTTKGYNANQARGFQTKHPKKH